MILIPKSINHPNILDEEIEAYYAIKCVKNADYDFDKQFDKVLTEYVNEIKFKNNGARRSFKSQLKKMVLVDKPKNSKKYSAFIQWRLRQIEFHKNKQRDYLMSKKVDSPPVKDNKKIDELLNTIDEKNKLIEKLMKENKQLKEQLNEKQSPVFIEDEKNFITSDDEEEEVIFTDEEVEE